MANRQNRYVDAKRELFRFILLCLLFQIVKLEEEGEGMERERIGMPISLPPPQTHTHETPQPFSALICGPGGWLLWTPLPSCLLLWLPFRPGLKETAARDVRVGGTWGHCMYYSSPLPNSVQTRHRELHAIPCPFSVKNVDWLPSHTHPNRLKPTTWVCAWPGIEPATFRSVGQCSNQLSCMGQGWPNSSKLRFNSFPPLWLPDAPPSLEVPLTSSVPQCTVLSLNSLQLKPLSVPSVCCQDPTDTVREGYSVKHSKWVLPRFKKLRE